MIAVNPVHCAHESRTGWGKDKNGKQRFRCKVCGKTFVERVHNPLGNMRLDADRAARAVEDLMEGMSVRSTHRRNGMSRTTFLRMLLEVGENCDRLLRDKIQGVEVSDVEVDEIWSFVHCKEKIRERRDLSEEFGDVWVFTAIEANTKLLLAHQTGKRDGDTAYGFLRQLKHSVGTSRFQITTDGYNAYRHGVPFIFYGQVDFAQIRKEYRGGQNTHRYSPGTIVKTKKIVRLGDPDYDRICTSHVERFNLTVRTQMRRYTRLASGHSKSLRHHAAAVSLFVAYYNFCRPHMSLGGRTPAMASSLTGHRWSAVELLTNASACH